MTRWELIKAFHKLARVLFANDVDEKETLRAVKEIVLDVLTETEEPAVKFTAGE